MMTGSNRHEQRPRAAATGRQSSWQRVSTKARLLLAAACAVAFLPIPAAIWLCVAPHDQATNAAALRDEAVHDTVSEAQLSAPAAQQVTLQEAATAVFGSPSGGSKVLSDHEAELAFTPARLLRIGEAYALISNGNDGQQFGTRSVALHYLRRRGSDLIVSGEWLSAGGIHSGAGQGGGPDDWSIDTALSQYPVLYSEMGGMWQGYSCGTASFVEFRPEGPSSWEPASLFYDDSGAVQDGAHVEIEGHLTNVVRSRSFEIAYTGTSNFTARYVRRGRTFVLRERSRMPEC